MYMIEISESKMDKMSKYAEEMLRAGGKLMQCLEEYGERNNDYDDDYRDNIGYRRGRYGRYR